MTKMTLCHTNLAPALTCQAHAPHQIPFQHGRHEGSLLSLDDMNHAWFSSWHENMPCVE